MDDLCCLVVAEKVASNLCPSLAENKNLPKSVIKKREDFLKSFKGYCVRSKFFAVYSIPNKEEKHRLGSTIPKAVGKAVIRNRLRRWGKEIFRKLELGGITTGIDFHICINSKRLTKDEFKNVEYKVFKSALEEAFQKTCNHYSK